MTRKQQRIATIAFIVTGIAFAVALSLYALRDNVTYFKTPTDLITMSRNQNTTKFIRLGGQVEFGSIEKTGLVTRFVVTDLVNDVPVEYSGIVPDLFKEGKGVVAIGNYDGTFHASQILAKHDENYTPPDVAKVLKQNAAKASIT
ncbi:MAG: Cytochrome c-type biosis protein CcmE, heme chaperone, partial [Micavibrio sp.]|nr:Cytochrome c-type biosis protein CcmE, heme chaperone [Micavibrio sp.]